jgi:hypothetical protein
MDGDMDMEMRGRDEERKEEKDIEARRSSKIEGQERE